MCGRFAIATPIHELADTMGCEPLSDLTPFEASWNVAPQTLVPVGTEVGVHGEINVPRHFRLMQWGFRPSWSKASNREPINARSETMHEKPMFRNAAKHRRGFVPADGWYEWMTTPQGKAPWFHQRMDTQPTMLAVLWETWVNGDAHLESCVVLTQPANEDCQEVHNRMPVLLDHSTLSDWLSSGRLPPVPPLGAIDRHPVSRDVNSVNNNHRGLIQPLPRLFDHEYGA